MGAALLSSNNLIQVVSIAKPQALGGQALPMDRSSPRQAARRPKVPLAAAATVLQASPAPPSARPRFDAPFASMAIAFAVMAGAAILNSPVRDQFSHGWAWGLLGFAGEVGGLLALLGMLFRQPVMGWVGASGFFAVALLVSSLAWPGHLLALALIGAVAAWQMRRQARQDEEKAQRDEDRRRQGWLPS